MEQCAPLKFINSMKKRWEKSQRKIVVSLTALVKARGHSVLTGTSEDLVANGRGGGDAGGIRGGHSVVGVV